MWHHKNPDIKFKYNCTKCPYSTNYNTNYSSHLLVHSADKFYECSVCNNGFSTQGQLNKHYVIHTGERFKNYCPNSS